MSAPHGKDEKQRYYQRAEVASGYDHTRFRSAGGARVDQREREAVLDLVTALPRTARILDLPVGTGRLLEALRAAGFTAVEGADASPAMLDAARRRLGPEVALRLEDAFATSYDAASFDAVVCLRFFFHHAQPGPLLRELFRLLKPGGALVFDTLRWSPRALFPRVQERLGGRVWTITERELVGQLRATGFELVEARRALLLPSQLYAGLPRVAVALVDALEERLPGALRSKAFWKAQKPLGRG